MQIYGDFRIISVDIVYTESPETPYAVSGHGRGTANQTDIRRYLYHVRYPSTNTGKYTAVEPWELRCNVLLTLDNQSLCMYVQSMAHLFIPV